MLMKAMIIDRSNTNQVNLQERNNPIYGWQMAIFAFAIGLQHLGILLLLIIINVNLSSCIS